MEKKVNQQVIIVKWTQGLIVEGNFKKIFINRFNRKMLILENNNKKLIVPLTTVLENILKKYKNLLEPDVKIRIECLGTKGKNKYYDYEILIGDRDLTTGFLGLELL